MFNERLKIERKRLKLSQTEFGEACGVKIRAQINYEKGERTPDSDYLQKAEDLGVDTHYLLTGKPANSTLSADEAFLLEQFRSLPEPQRKLVLGLLVGGIGGINNSVVNSANVSISNNIN